MTCREAHGLLMAWLDSELDARATSEIGEHLAACGACRARFEGEERVERGIRNLLLAERMPEGVWERLQGGLRPAHFRYVPWFAAAAAILLAVGIAVWSRPASPQILDDLTRTHLESAGGGTRPDFPAPAPAEIARFLAARGLPDVHLPGDGVVEGHTIHILGVRGVSVHGTPGVEVTLTCCGFPASVFVLPKTVLGDDPALARALAGGRPVARRGANGVRASLSETGSALVAVLSKHETSLR